MVADEEKEEVETLKARVLAMRSGAHHTGSAQSPISLHNRDDHHTTPISLDVGGTVYTASRAVLRAVPDSWLARVVSGGISLARNANDMFFIERDSQAFRHILMFLRAVSASESSGMKPNKQPSPAANLPSSRDELAILLSECQFYELPDLEAEVSKALKAAPTISQSVTPGGTVSATTVAGVVDDTTDIYSKASRMQLEFQSVYVTISSSNGLQFTEDERRTAMAEVNARTAELQDSGFRVKAMNTGVAQDRKTKDYCMYFHAVLVRNTGKRVPAANGEPTSQLPPRASQTHVSSITSTSQSQSQSSHQLSRHRQTPSSARPSAQQGNTSQGGSKRNVTAASDSQHAVRSADSSSLQNERPTTPQAVPHAHRSSSEGGRDSGVVASPAAAYSGHTASKPRAERSAASGSGLPRGTGRTSSVPNGHASHSHPGRDSHGGIDSVAPPKPSQHHTPPQRSSSTGMHAQRSASTGAVFLGRDETGTSSAPGSHGGAGKDNDGALHQSTGATSAHAKSTNSQQVNTSSTIDSMLAAGQQQTTAAGSSKPAASSSSGADVEKAHAAALANLGLPYVLEGGPRRHAEVRVFDINTDGPPKGIPREWEEGLLEGRKRPPGAPPVSHVPAGPKRVQDGGGREHNKADEPGGEVRSDEVRLAAQSAAEASVEQAKRRAAAKAKAMSGPRTQPPQHGPPMHQVERGPKTVRHFDLPATNDIMRSKSDLHLYVRDAKDLARPLRPPSVDLHSSAATSESAAIVTDDISSSNPRSRHRFRLPSTIGRVFGGKRDSRRSASVTALGHSSTTPLAQHTSVAEARERMKAQAVEVPVCLPVH